MGASLTAHFMNCMDKAVLRNVLATNFKPLVKTAFGSSIYQSVKLSQTTELALPETVSHPGSQDKSQMFVCSLETGLKAVEFSSLPINLWSTTNDIFQG